MCVLKICRQVSAFYRLLILTWSWKGRVGSQASSWGWENKSSIDRQLVNGLIIIVMRVSLLFLCLLHKLHNARVLLILVSWLQAFSVL